MNDHDDTGMHEPFGPEYVRPPKADCPDCPCCTAALCQTGRTSVLQCRGHVAQEELRATVANCPCSAESSTGTLAWRVMQVRAVSLATEKPLLPHLEIVLSAVAHGQASPERAVEIGVLAARNLVKVADSGEELTEYGRRYLEARAESRQATAVQVIDVDVETRLARVMLAERRTERLVTVPMDQLANRHTALKPGELPGSVLFAQANCAADRDEDVVLTQVRNPLLPGNFAGSRASEGGQ